MRAVLAGLVTATLLLFAAAAQTSGANFTAQRSNVADSVAADTPFNYVHLYSEASDPAGKPHYATKQGATPTRTAATGTDSTLAVELGNRRSGGDVTRVFVIQTPTAFPAGLAQITVSLNVVSSAPAALNGPIATMATIANGNGVGNTGNSGGSATLTLGPDQRRQVNLAVPALPGAGQLYRGRIDVKVTYAGYTDSFLTFPVPLSVYDGLTGGGP
jgi:hypothetical protein